MQSCLISKMFESLQPFQFSDQLDVMETFEPNWDRIVEDLGPRLYRYFLASFSMATASDAVQETLLRLVQKTRSGDFDPLKGSLTSYAFGIAHWIRCEYKKKPNFPLVEDESVFDLLPAENDLTTDEKESLVRLRQAIAKLKPIEQEIISLSIDGELELKDIAITLGLPLGTVKSHIHRAKENLRAILEVHDERR